MRRKHQKLAEFHRLRSMTYQLITQEPDYAMFSNTAYNDGRGTGLYNSIENMHNAIHAIVGNGGHMVCDCVDYLQRSSNVDMLTWKFSTVDNPLLRLRSYLLAASYVSSFIVFGMD